MQNEGRYTLAREGMSLRKSARYVGASNKRLYAIKKPRIIKIDKKMADLVQQIGQDRPTYGYGEWPLLKAA